MSKTTMFITKNFKTNNLAVLGILASIGLMITAKADGTGLLDFIPKLSSPKYVERQQAGDAAFVAKRKVDTELMEQLRKQLANPDRNYGGAFHQTLRAISAWHVEEAIDPLMKNVDFKLDEKTFPVGLLPTSSAYFPVATALIELSGPQVRQGIFTRLTQPSEDSLLRILALVLRQSEGQETAKLLIQSRISSVSSRRKISDLTTTTDTELNNLQKILLYVEPNKIGAQNGAALNMP